MPTEHTDLDKAIYMIREASGKKNSPLDKGVLSIRKGDQ